MTIHFDPNSATAANGAKSAHAEARIGGFAIELYDQPEALADEWRALEQSAVTTWFQSHAWVSSWCRTAAPVIGETPLLIAGRDATNALAFVLPLALHRNLGLTWLGWLGQSHAGYGFGVYRPDTLAALDPVTLRRILHHVARCRPGIAGCILKRQPRSWTGRANPFAALPQSPSPMTATAFDLKPDFEGLMNQTYSAKKRSELRRSLNQLRKSEPVSIAIAASAAERLAAFAAFQQQKSEQLAAEGHNNPFVTAPIAAFYNDYLAKDPAGGTMAIGTMTVGAGVVAVDIAAVFGDRIYGLNRSMKSGDIRKSSPGRHVNHALIEHAFAKGCAVYDLGPGESSYKDDWNGHTITMFETAMALSPAGILAAHGYSATASAKAALKNQPRLWNALNGLRRKARLHRYRGQPGTP